MKFIHFDIDKSAGTPPPTPHGASGIPIWMANELDQRNLQKEHLYGRLHVYS